MTTPLLAGTATMLLLQPNLWSAPVVPTDEPLTLAGVKEYLRIKTAAEDDKITAMIPRARLWVEDYTGFAIVQRQFIERRRPVAGRIRLYRWPLVSVASVTYGDGVAYTPRTWAPDTVIAAAAGGAWPILDPEDAFSIIYTAGPAVGQLDARLVGAMLALIEGEYSTGQAYPQDAVDAAERCCGYLRTPVL